MPSLSFLKEYSSKFLLLVILAVLFLLGGKYFSIDQETCQNFLGNFPLALSAAVFVVLYIVVTSLIWLGPKDIFRIASAFIYGAFFSTLLVWIGEMGNVIVLFMLSRKLGRGYVEKRLKGGMKHLDETIAETSFWSIFFLKAFPIVPLRFLDLGFGLTKISLKKYFIISALGSPLRIFFLQFFLSLGVETATNPYKMAEYLNENPLIWKICFFYCIGCFALIYFMKRKSRRQKGSS